MATLQATRQWSAATAKTRLKNVSRERTPQQKITTPEVNDEATDTYSAPTMAGSAANAARAYQGRLSEMEQRQLLLQTVTVYPGWQLVSVQHRPESDVLVAYLVRNYDQGDPIIAIREGRAMQIIMDAVGDLKVQHPRRRRESLLRKLLRTLGLPLGGADKASSFGGRAASR